MKRKMSADENLSLNLSPVVCAHALLEIDSEIKCIDPLKLQKLLYYSFSFTYAMFNECLWNFEKSPLICHHHGPYNKEVHNIFGGYSIDSTKRESSRLSLSGEREKLSTATKTILTVVYYLYLEKSGRELEEMTHGELPWMNALYYQSLCLNDIEKEFSSFDKVKDFWISYLKLPVESHIYNETLY